jgi:carbonic anhydrase
VATEPLEAKYIPSLHQATHQVLWIGCSDSNPRESNVFDFLPDQLLVLRNIGNMIVNDDLSSETAIKHAVVDLQVRHIVVCGHYGCGIVKTASRDGLKGPWLYKLNSLYAAHEEDINKAPVTERDRSFVELNVLDQLRSLRKLTEVIDAIKKGHLQIHGLVYDTKTERAYRMLEGQQSS